MSKYYEVTFEPEGKKAVVPEGTSLLETVRLAGLRLETPCDGSGTCGKCMVEVKGRVGFLGEIEPQLLTNVIEDGVQLACRTQVAGPLQIRLIASREETLQSVVAGQSLPVVLKPRYRRISLQTKNGGESLWDSLGMEHDQPVEAERMIRLLQDLARKERNFTEGIIRDDTLVDLCFVPGQKCLGLALDIGTTSMVAELVDLESGQTLGTKSCLNPQTTYGGDVLTRISFAQKQDGTSVLQREVLNGINELIHVLCSESGTHYEQIFHLVVAANTTMLHLLLGVNPGSLAVAPYRPVFTHCVEVSQNSLGVKIAPSGLITLLPSASAFVGADILAGLLATGFQHYREPSLFIDIGTNGEIVVVKDGNLVGTSSAAGPALEGMNISCGYRAEQGAIDSVQISDDGEVIFSTIDRANAIGICGSGLIELVTELVKEGVIERNGRFVSRENLPPGLANRIIDYNGQKAFLVTKAGEIVLTQKDIRQVQLAKGAMAAGINLLLKEMDLIYCELERVLVAGAFGFHLKPHSLAAIGLVPWELFDRIEFVGNTAKEGAKAVLLNQEVANEISSIYRRIKIKELSLQPEFQTCFVRNLDFPPVGNRLKIE